MADNNLHIAFSRKDKNQPIKIPLSSLKRHFAALGSSGSGKTVLVKCVIEECIRNNVPIVLVDLQGDLASLALMGDKKEVEKRGVPGSYYDEIEKKKQVVIFTPASTKGVSISMNPLKSPPPHLDKEDLIQAIDSVADTVTNILGFDAEKGKGQDVKSYLYLLLQALWEESKEVKTFGDLANYITDDSFMDASSRAMIDDKTKEQLSRKVKTMTIGADSLIFNLGVSLDLEKMMNWADSGKVPVNVLYLNTLRKQEDRINFIADTANQVYNWMLRNPSKNIQLVFVLDELAGLVPPIRNPPSKKSIQLLLKQARKYGVSLLLATQNISDVDYKSLGQVGTWALGRLMAKQDIDKVRDIIQAISPTETEAILSELTRQKTGQFMLLAPDVFNSVQSIQARWLVTNHMTLDEAAVKKIMDESGLRSKFPEAKSTAPEEPEEEVPGPEDEEEEQELEEEIDDDPEIINIPEIKSSKEITNILEAQPIALSVDEISDRTGENTKVVKKNLDKLVTDKKLDSYNVEDLDLYWSKKYKMDPEHNIIGPIFRSKINVPIAEAEKILKDNWHKTLGRAQETYFRRPKLLYIPLWKIGTINYIEKGFLKKSMYEIKRSYNINGLTGELLNFIPKESEIMFDPRPEIDKIETVPMRSVILTQETIDGLKDEDLKPLLNRQHARTQIEKLIGAQVNPKKVPSVVWMPIWEFTLKYKDNKVYLPHPFGKGESDTSKKFKQRCVWVDALFGTFLEKHPYDDEDTQYNYALK